MNVGAYVIIIIMIIIIIIIIIIITSNNHRLQSAGLNALEELLRYVGNAQRR